MDATLRPHSISPTLFAYAENKKICEIFQTILENLIVDHPSNPLEYLYDLLTKGAVYNTPKVYILGPRSPERCLVCSALTLKLGLTHVTRTSLLEVDDLEKVPSSADWAGMVKKRVSMPDCALNGWILEAFPQTRKEAFLLRKHGIFPTHIALVEPADMMDGNGCDLNEEIQTYSAQKLLILDFLRNCLSKTFVLDSDIDASINKVVEFVRTKKTPPMPYLPRVLLLGPCGSGRRTVSQQICKKYHLVRVDFQEELRKAAMKDSPFKEKIHTLLNKSSPVPDNLLVQIASSRLLRKDCIERGWMMFDFPETVSQAELLAKQLEGFQINRAVFLDATLETCLQRVEPRRIDPVTGSSFLITDSLEEKVKKRLIQLPQDSVTRIEAEHKRFTENAKELKLFFRFKMADDIAVEVDANEKAENVLECVQGAILQSSKMKLLE